MYIPFKDNFEIIKKICNINHNKLHIFIIKNVL